MSRRPFPVISRSSTTHVAATVLGILASASALADVTIEETMALEGAGMMSLANMTGRTTSTYAGDRARIESDVQMQSGMMRMMARGLGPTAEIVRLDEDKVYELDLKKKRYTESTLAERRAELQQGIAQAQEAQRAQAGEQAQCEWLPPKVDVKRTGSKQTIGGYGAEQVLISARQGCRDPKTDSICEYELALDQWVSPDVRAGDDALRFQRAYAERMGLSAALSEGFSQRAEGQFGRYGEMWKEIARRIGDLQGYPVRSSFTLALGGPQCKSPPAGGGAGASGSGSPFGGLAGQLGGQLGGLLGGRRKAETEPSAAAGSTQPGAPVTTASGLATLFTMRSELVSIRNDAVPAATFEIPAGFKKGE
jgi:hypothetical protein